MTTSSRWVVGAKNVQDCYTKEVFIMDEKPPAQAPPRATEHPDVLKDRQKPPTLSGQVIDDVIAIEIVKNLPPLRPPRSQNKRKK